MLGLKKIAITILALGANALFAGTMGPVCTPGNVTVPCETNAWSFGAQALYLKSTLNQSASYIGRVSTSPIDTENITLRTQNITTIYQDFNPKWNWGFQIAGSYYFNSGNDMTINWYHLNTGNSFYGPFLPQGIKEQSLAVDRVLTDVVSNFHWDAVNAEFGQFTDFSTNSKIRFHGGAQFVSLSSNLNQFTSFGITNSNLTSSYNTSRFNGFGPRTGIDLTYVTFNNFGLYAKGAAAILVGTSKFYGTFTAQNAIEIRDSQTVQGSRNTVVPELDARLGANYIYAMPQGSLILDAGYMWFNYFNTQDLSASAQTDFAANGPYVGLKYVGNV